MTKIVFLVKGEGGGDGGEMPRRNLVKSELFWGVVNPKYFSSLPNPRNKKKEKNIEKFKKERKIPEKSVIKIKKKKNGKMRLMGIQLFSVQGVFARC